jgi:hypothetical protein
MRRPSITLGLALLGFLFISCVPSGPSTLEVVNSLEIEVNEHDLAGVMALFAEDALWDASYRDETCEGYVNIEWCWEVYFMTPVPSEFRDISVDGDTATFTWVEFRSGMNKFWPTIVKVKRGKITLIEWPQEPMRESTDFD